MAARISDVAGTDRPTVEITRVLDAPRELVWRAWTVPEHFKKWWGPKGFTAPVAEIDLRVGGRFLFCMRSPGGNEMWTTGTYLEIVPLQRLVFTEALSDPDGTIIPYQGEDGLRSETTTVSVLLEDREGRTELTLRHSGFPPGQASDHAAAGWAQAFDKLAESLR